MFFCTCFTFPCLLMNWESLMSYSEAVRDFFAGGVTEPAGILGSDFTAGKVSTQILFKTEHNQSKNAPCLQRCSYTAGVVYAEALSDATNLLQGSLNLTYLSVVFSTCGEKLLQTLTNTSMVEMSSRFRNTALACSRLQLCYNGNGILKRGWINSVCFL